MNEGMNEWIVNDSIIKKSWKDEQINQSINQWLNEFIIRDDIKPAPKMPGMDSNARVPDQVY